MNNEPVSYMTALQLADFIDENVAPFMNDHQMYLDYATVMLRQQQAEYYSLLVNHDKLYAKVVEQQAEIEALKAELKLIDELVRGAK